MTLPTKDEAFTLLTNHVTDPYQRFHAEMVGAVMAGYATKFSEDAYLWWLTGYLHDIDYNQHPTEHPGPSLTWFAEWGYPNELIHAVEAHADGFNGFTTKPNTILARSLLACDEICGLIYAYQKLNRHAAHVLSGKSPRQIPARMGAAPVLEPVVELRR